MTTFIYKPLIVLIVAILMAISPLCVVFAECQKLGEYCGDPPTDTFPVCCQFDTNGEGEQVPLKCNNLDNGVGTCEIDEGN